MRYRYVVYGKEKHIDTGIHPISLHKSLIGACVSFLMAHRYFTHLRIA